ncbi:hypothetical protein [Pseudarthrobacter sp. PvP090]|uniref:hypothetical protein n=1 Tax=Pseudarthrobacter sp. PvP090 TaxID=3156393 RepID=UPI00339148CF
MNVAGSAVITVIDKVVVGDTRYRFENLVARLTASTEKAPEYTFQDYYFAIRAGDDAREWDG